MACLEEIDTAVVIAVIENFVCDALQEVDKSNAEAVGHEISKTIDSFLEIVETQAKRLKKTRFALAPPTLRPAYQWYTANHEMMTHVFKEKFQAKKMSNVTITDGPSSAIQTFVSDQIHLTKESALGCLDVIIGSAEEFFGAEIIEIPASDDDMETEETVEVEKEKEKEKESSKLRTVSATSESSSEDDDEDGEVSADEAGADERAERIRSNENKKRRREKVVKSRLKVSMVTSGSDLASGSGAAYTYGLVSGSTPVKVKIPSGRKKSKPWIDECPTPDTVDRLTFRSCIAGSRAAALASEAGASATTAPAPGQSMAAVVKKVKDLESQVLNLRNDLMQMGSDVKQRWENDKLLWPGSGRRSLMQ